MQNEKKILVAVDGSAFSSHALDYLIQVFSEDTTVSIHLVQVTSLGSANQSWKLEVDPYRSLSPQAASQQRIATKYLKDAQARLLRYNFNNEQITYSVEVSSGSQAVTIHHLARSGMYDALLIGRRGIGTIGEMFFGSVSSYLFGKLHEIPLWIIDGVVTYDNFLVGVHHTPESLMAVDHLAFILQGRSDVKIYLYHSDVLLGQKPSPKPKEFYGAWGKEWCQEHLDLDDHLFHAHTRILKDNGIKSNQIKKLPVHTGLDAGRNLLKQAENNKCGTIIIGRRGKDMVKGWSRRVSNSTLQLAHNIAIWIVG